MSQSAPVSRNGAYRFVFPLPAYCAYTGGAIPVASTDTREATATSAYPSALVIPVNAPAYKAVHVEDAEPRNVVAASPYPSSNFRVLPAHTPVHVEDAVPKKPRFKRS
jgi:hypothetical protein